MAGRTRYGEDVMSRTDAHRPYRALRLSEPEAFREVHNHCDGICDLDEYIKGELSSNSHWINGNCYFKYRGRRSLCGCNWCSNGSREETRWNRHETKRILNDALKERSWENVDVWPRRAFPG